MTVGFYSPLPPAKTGVADYSGALLGALRRHGTVEISPKLCKTPLYHLGNNRQHVEIYRRALAEPGVTVLHDAVLNHFLLGQLDEGAYADEFAYNYGEWHRELGRALWRGRASSGADERYFQFPMLRRVVERSRAVIVHNPAAARAVKRHVPAARVFEIPHLFAPPLLPGEGEVERYRQALGVPPGAFLFAVFGYLRESKRLMAVLETFGKIRGGQAKACPTMLVAGDFVSADLERAAADLLKAPGIVRRPFLEEREFWLAARAVDACINLRHPSAGETSGIAIRLMGLGKAVMVTDSEEYARIPEDAVVRIPAGLAERDSLSAHMILLTSVFDAARAIGRQGARHIAACHRLEDAAEQYWKVLCEFSS